MLFLSEMHEKHSDFYLNACLAACLRPKAQLASKSRVLRSTLDRNVPSIARIACSMSETGNRLHSEPVAARRGQTRKSAQSTLHMRA